MKFLIALSLKNLFRYKRRTLITASALAFGITAYLNMDSLLLGMQKESERNLIWYETGSFTIRDKTYIEEEKFLPLKYVIENPAPINVLLAERGFESTPRIVFSGEIFFNQEYMRAKFIAIDPAQDSKVFKIKQTILPGGEYFASDEYAILIGKNLAKDLGVAVGDSVLIRTKTRYGSWQPLDLTVKGIIDAPNPAINRGTVFIPLAVVDRELEMAGAVTEIAATSPEWLNLAGRMQGLPASLIRIAPNLRVQTWEELGKDFIMVSEQKTKGSAVMLFLLFFIAVIGITNTMLMAVFERIREIGMMRALGMKDPSIIISFILEAAGIGLIGSLVGIAIGTLLNYFLITYGLDFSSIIGDTDIGYRVAGIYRGSWHPEAIILSLVFGVFTCMLIAVLPARKALKMEITTALRVE